MQNYGYSDMVWSQYLGAAFLAEDASVEAGLPASKGLQQDHRTDLIYLVDGPLLSLPESVN